MANPAQLPEVDGSDGASPDEPLPALVVASNENQVHLNPIVRQIMAALAWVERKNLQYSVHGTAEVFDPALLPWVASLEDSWTLIRGELARLMMGRTTVSAFQDAGGDPLTTAQERGWRTAPLLSYGFPYEATIARCPETWRLLQNVPGLVGAMFSILEPGRFLPSHHGPYNGLLRLHLGLIIPEPAEKVGIRVVGRILQWEEGRALIFDDTLEHEAWNDTDHTRAVLLLDFARPLRFPARLLNWLVLHIFLFRPFIREGLDRARWWERSLYRQAQAARQARFTAATVEDPRQQEATAARKA